MTRHLPLLDLLTDVNRQMSLNVDDEYLIPDFPEMAFEDTKTDAVSVWSPADN